MFRRLFRKKPKLATQSSDKIKSALVSTAGTMMPVSKSPDELYGELFDDVHREKLFVDNKQFVDLVPRKRARDLRKAYEHARKQPGFDMQAFVEDNFYAYAPRHHAPYAPDENTTAREHVSHLWTQLERRNRKTRGSLFPLPHPYVVPGGRFDEQFYWDSYFIMLGLAADHKWSIMNGMMKNYAYMLRKFGLIPTANRNYFLSRSQPPFFSHMVKLLARHRGRTLTYTEYLPSMLSEYRFWMKGRKVLKDHTRGRAMLRVVRMPNSVVLNRYFDNKSTARPEMPTYDYEAAHASDSHDKERIYVDLRASAESGWDFSSRWFRIPSEIETIHTTDIVPVDLNCLLYQHEMTIAEAYTLLKQPLIAKRFREAAERRADTIRRYFWDKKYDFFTDYDYQLGTQTHALTLAGVFPLYAKIATSEQARAVAERLEKNFLKRGGLTTTLVENGQQWDSPNGWAPLQWVAIQGLREYGYHGLADTIRDRWLMVNEEVYEKHRKMIEKYDVIHPSGIGGGGEYAVQDGFGWTNGVYAALKDEQEKHRGE